MMTHATILGLGSLVALSLAAPTSWKATLKATDNSPVSGTATVEPVGADSTRASVKVSGAKAGSELAWHIHTGACGSQGKIVGPAASYGTIKVGPEGNADGTAVLPIAAPTSGEFAVTVHASTTDMTPVACGNLTPDTSMPKPMPTDSMHTMDHSDSPKSHPDSTKPRP